MHAQPQPEFGVSGRIARYFQSAQITPLLALIALLLGVFAVLVTPREEEPQINVTMANVLIPFPGASAQGRRADGRGAGRAGDQPDRRRRARDVGVAARARRGHRPVQVGVPRITALVSLYDTILSNQDWLPRNLGTLQPIVKPKGIDDVPIVTLALFAKDATAGPADLERVAHAIEVDLKRVPRHARSGDHRRPAARDQREARPGADECRRRHGDRNPQCAAVGQQRRADRRDQQRQPRGAARRGPVLPRRARHREPDRRHPRRGARLPRAGGDARRRPAAARAATSGTARPARTGASIRRWSSPSPRSPAKTRSRSPTR